MSSNTCRRRVTGRRTIPGRHASAPLPGTRPSGSLQPRGCPRGRGGLARPSRHLREPVLHSSETRSHLSASRSPTGALGPWWLRAGPPATLTGTEPGAIPRFRSKPVGAAGPALMSSSNARDGNGRSAVLCRDAPAFTQTQRGRAERPGNDSPRIRLLLFPCRSTTFLSQVTTHASPPIRRPVSAPRCELCCLLQTSTCPCVCVPDKSVETTMPESHLEKHSLSKQVQRSENYA